MEEFAKKNSSLPMPKTKKGKMIIVHLWQSFEFYPLHSACSLLEGAAVRHLDPDSELANVLVSAEGPGLDAPKGVVVRFPGPAEHPSPEVLRMGNADPAGASFSKKSKDYLYGRSTQNTVVVFPKENISIGDFIKVKIDDCTSATLLGKKC